MIRKILSLAVMAIVALLVFKVALALLGLVLGLVIGMLVLAAFGYGLYLVLRVISPKTADRVQEVIRGRPRPTA